MEWLAKYITRIDAITIDVTIFSDVDKFYCVRGRGKYSEREKEGEGGAAQMTIYSILSFGIEANFVDMRNYLSYKMFVVVAFYFKWMSQVETW